MPAWSCLHWSLVPVSGAEVNGDKSLSQQHSYKGSRQTHCKCFNTETAIMYHGWPEVCRFIILMIHCCRSRLN